MGLLQDIQEKYGEIETSVKEDIKKVSELSLKDVVKSDLVSGLTSTLFPQSVGLKKQFSPKYLSSFEKGQINKTTDMLTGLEQSVIELGVYLGFTENESKQILLENSFRYKKYKPEDRAIASMGAFVFEAASAAPLATLKWFNSGNRVTQIFKQGGFGYIWDYVFTPETEEASKAEAGKQAAFLTAGAQAIFGIGGRLIEKATSFDFKDNINSVKDAAKSYNIKPEVLGDFTGSDAKRAAETVEQMRGGSIVSNIKNNLNKLKKAVGTLSDPFVRGAKKVNEVGKFTLQRLKTIHDTNKKRANKLYERVDNRVKALIKENPDANIVNVSNTRKIVEDLEENEKDLLVKISSSLNRPDLVSKLRTLRGKFDEQTIVQKKGIIVDEIGKPLIPEIAETKKITFTEMRRLREQVGAAYQESIKAGFANDATRKLVSLLNSIDQDLDEWADNFVDNKGIKEAYDKARKFYGNNVIPFRDADLAVALIKDPSSKELLEDASTFIQKLVNPAKESQEGANRMIKLISPLLDEDTKKVISKKIFDDAFETATDKKSGNFDPNAFINYIKQRKTNLKPFLVGDANIDKMVNKYSILARALSRGDENTLMGIGDDVLSGAMAKASPVTSKVIETLGGGNRNKVTEFITRQVFNTKLGREMLLSAKSIKDFYPLITAGTLAFEEGTYLPQEEPERIDLEENFDLEKFINIEDRKDEDGGAGGGGGQETKENFDLEKLINIETE